MTFAELMSNTPKTEAERLLIQAIAMLTVEPRYSSKTPEEVFEQIEWTTNEVARSSPS